MLVITQIFVSRQRECQCRLVTYLLNFIISTLFISNFITLKENSPLETKMYPHSILYFNNFLKYGFLPNFVCSLNNNKYQN